MVHRFRGKRGHGLHPTPLVACGSTAGRGRTQSAESADPSVPPTQLVVDEEQGRTGYFFARRHCVTTLRAALASRGTAAPSPAALRLATPVGGAGQQRYRIAKGVSSSVERTPWNGSDILGIAYGF